MIIAFLSLIIDNNYHELLKINDMATWVTQSVNHSTLDFISICDLTVIKTEPTLDMEPAQDFLSPSLPLPLHLPCSHGHLLFLSKKKNQIK